MDPSDTESVSKLMFAVPSNDWPFMVLAVSRAVAVAAFPVVDPEDPDVLPVTFPVKLPVTSPVTLPTRLPLMFPDAVTVPTDIFGVPVRSDANEAVPVKFPVTFPVTSPVRPPVKVVAATDVNPDIFGFNAIVKLLPVLFVEISFAVPTIENVSESRSID